MFKRNIVLRAGGDPRHELTAFESALRDANLPPPTQQFLQEQVETTLLQFERQLTTGPIHKVVADRLFEGDGYRVTVRVRSGKESAIDKIKGLLGIG